MLTTFLAFEKCKIMPANNNYQKVVPNAASRIGSLPVVRSACATLSVLYRDAKSSNTRLRSLCEALESGVTTLSTAACTGASPVIVKLEPQSDLIVSCCRPNMEWISPPEGVKVSIANDFACKGLDWLETSFPVLLSPPDEVVAAAKNKVNGIRDVVCIAAGGTVETVQHTVTWVIGRLNQVDSDVGNQSMVERAIRVASVGLDSALTLSEAFLDQVLPPPEGDKDEEACLMEGFEATVRSGSYHGRVIKLTAKACRRTYHTVGSKIHSVQIMESLSRSATLVQDLQTDFQTLVWSLQGLPQYLQHQAVSVFFFISQMYNLSCPSSRQEQTRGRSHVRAAEASSLSKEQARSQNIPSFRLRPSRISAFENGCLIKGCVRR